MMWIGYIRKIYYMFRGLECFYLFDFQGDGGVEIQFNYIVKGFSSQVYGQKV